MTEPKFLWDRVLRMFFGLVALVVLVLFWIGAVIFAIGNLAIAWHRLWRYLGVWNLVVFRFIMRMRNLYDTSRLLLAGRTDPRDLPGPSWDPRYQYQRTPDGSFNDLRVPNMGSAGTPFGRNVPPNRLKRPESHDIVGQPGLVGNPTPREVSQVLLTRDRFRPATTLNLLSAAWIQFQVHDWFSHKRSNNSLKIELKEGDTWPDVKCGRNNNDGPQKIRLNEEILDKDKVCSAGKNGPMEIRLNEEVADKEKVCPAEFRKADFPEDFPIYTNTESHWWDGSQIYGQSKERQMKVRDAQAGLGKLRVDPDGRLLPEEDPDLDGIELTGSNDNWWVGLSLFHTLFTLEHNSICDALRQAYPDWDDERLFQTARLVNTMLMAKIHTVEWTPAILGHPTLLLGMRSNWNGILGRFNKLFGRSKLLTGIQEELTGIPGSNTDHHAAPYCMTEEFASVYRMHPLIPDEYRFYSSQSDELIAELGFDSIQGHNTRPAMNKISMEDLFYSFGTAHPGSISLHNFPRALQNFTRIKEMGGKGLNEKQVRNEKLDLGAIDVFRDRERAVPRYNLFRRLVFRLPETSYRHLVGLPMLIPSLSGLSRRERRERMEWVEELRALYGRNNVLKQIAYYCGFGKPQGIDRLDTMVGLTAERPPKGFGFCDTAFRIFVLMASRRLKSDRFFTEGYIPEVYTEIGMKWVEENNLNSVLQRHYPRLSAALLNVDNPFAPWKRIEQPSPEPGQAYPFTFTILPIIGGILAGGLAGWLVELFSPSESRFVAHVLDAAYSWSVLGGMVLGFCVGAMCQVIVHLFDNFLGRKITIGGLVAIVNLLIVIGTIYGFTQRPPADGSTVQAFMRSFARWETLEYSAKGVGEGLVVIAGVRIFQAWRKKPWRDLYRPLVKILPVMGLFAILGAASGWMAGSLVQLLRLVQNGTELSISTVLHTFLPLSDGSGSLADSFYQSCGALIGLVAGVMFALPKIRRIPIGVVPGATIGWLLGIATTLIGSSTWTGIGSAFFDPGLQKWILLCGLVLAIAVALDRGPVRAIPGFVVGCLAGAVVVGGVTLFFQPHIRLLDALLSFRASVGALVGAVLSVLLTLFVWQFRWWLRRSFWNVIALVKFTTNRPLAIKAKRPVAERIDTEPLPASLGLSGPHAMALDDIRIADRIPSDEKWVCTRTKYRLKQVMFRFQRWAYRWLPPMQDELPPVHADPYTALDHAYRGFRRSRYDAPILPAEFEGSPDLGSLAVRGPYACYLKRNDNGEWEWDLTRLGDYDCYPGLYKLGVRVTFGVEDSRLRERHITSAIGSRRYGEKGWQLAKQLALCALSNHTSLVRHWNWIHLIPAVSFAIATRNNLGADHPISRFLWPHIFGTMQSNMFGNMAQLTPDGDFENIFSFTRSGLYELLRDTHREFTFDITDPNRQAECRGLGEATFPLPTQKNLTDLFDRFLKHAKQYVRIYYPDGPLMSMVKTGQEHNRVRHEVQALAGWIGELNKLMPSHTGYDAEMLTGQELAYLLARFVYLVTALHEMVGSALWNYQLWTHRQPVRLYKDGRREPLDVYQRLVNYNYLLNVDRTPLVADYSHLALPGPKEEAARAVFRAFKTGLEDCELQMRKEPWAVWRLYPSDLEAHINA